MNMSEIRKHYFLDRHCIIATGRAKRPSAPKACNDDITSSTCVFCNGHEEETPPATSVYKKGQVMKDTDGQRLTGWDVRCIPNLYPALSPDAPQAATSGFEVQKGYGFHEVIVEHPLHGSRLHLFSDEEILLLMQVYRDRVMHYQSREGIKYVSLFKNWGKKAGASLDHTHSQLIALPLLPSEISVELQAIRHLAECPYCNIVKREKGSKRQIYENSHFIVIAPYCSGVPYELWILPQQHVHHLSVLTDEMLLSLGDCLRYAVSRLDATIPELAYNYMFFQTEGNPEYHFSARIQPVTSIAAGFEKNTGIYINSMPPEIAANHLMDRA
jgi:UDPglucose--hexose-1-phosphate uridylyltransferase